MAEKITVRKYIISYVDRGETCDYKARVLDICDTKEDAINRIHEDIKDWADDRAGADIKVDFDKMSASYNDRDEGCEWNIHEFDIVIDFSKLTLTN